MNFMYRTASIMLFLVMGACIQAEDVAEHQKHLFILSGQSNMHHMDPQVSFIPAVEEAFGKNNVTVVKSAKTGAPIRAWDKDYKWPENLPIPQGRKKPGKETIDRKAFEAEFGNRYEILMTAIQKQTMGKSYGTVTFIWMQGESDTSEVASLYSASFNRLVTRLKADLKIESLNIVIGRLSDYGQSEGWKTIRTFQVTYAQENANCAWVDTDDLNDKKKDDGTVENDLHYTEEGYKVFGQRCAEKAIALINKK